MGRACSRETKQDCTCIEANLPCVPPEMPSAFHDGVLQESVPIMRLLRQIPQSESVLAVKHLLMGLLQPPVARAAGSWGFTTNFLTGRAAAEQNEPVSALVISWACFYFPLP